MQIQSLITKFENSLLSESTDSSLNFPYEHWKVTAVLSLPEYNIIVKGYNNVNSFIDSYNRFIEMTSEKHAIAGALKCSGGVPKTKIIMMSIPTIKGHCKFESAAEAGTTLHQLGEMYLKSGKSYANFQDEIMKAAIEPAPIDQWPEFHNYCNGMVDDAELYHNAGECTLDLDAYLDQLKKELVESKVLNVELKNQIATKFHSDDPLNELRLARKSSRNYDKVVAELQRKDEDLNEAKKLCREYNQELNDGRKSINSAMLVKVKGLEQDLISAKSSLTEQAVELDSIYEMYSEQATKLSDANVTINRLNERLENSQLARKHYKGKYEHVCTIVNQYEIQLKEKV